MNAPPPIIASRYRVLRELGRGGMGVVYVVEHVHTGDQLALKVLLGQAAKDPQAVERFKREARASARIKSEHVVRVVDADVAPELEGAPFLVMELLNGSDLQKRIEATGKLGNDEVMHYLVQAANALDKSHAAGIVHRDLKPENLFLHTRHDGVTILKILDFGISKLVGGDVANDLASAGATKTGAVMGTPLYMSPEQARGRVNEIGPTTDVWAMGLIAMQLLTGEIYWRATTVAELMAEILSEPFYDPSKRWTGFPPQVDAWFARSCARDPNARFASVGEQIAALGLALRGEGGVGDARASISSMPGGAVTPLLTSGVAPPGTRTTTGAVSQDSSSLVEPSSPRRTAPIVFGLVGGLAVIAVVAGLVVVPRMSANGVSATTPPVPAATIVPASSLPVPSASQTAPTAQSAWTAAAVASSASSASSAPVATPAPAHHASTHPAPTTASPPPAAAGASPPPAAADKKNAARFDPTSL